MHCKKMISVRFFILCLVISIFFHLLQIILIASLITLIFRKLRDEYIIVEIDNFRNVDITEVATTGSVTMATTNQHGAEISRPEPPSESYIEMTRNKRIYEAQMVDVVIEIVVYFFYLFLCLLIAYGHRDPDAYRMTANIENTFYNKKFDKVNC